MEFQKVRVQKNHCTATSHPSFWKGKFQPYSALPKLRMRDWGRKEVPEQVPASTPKRSPRASEPTLSASVRPQSKVDRAAAKLNKAANVLQGKTAESEIQRLDRSIETAKENLDAFKAWEAATGEYAGESATLHLADITRNGKKIPVWAVRCGAGQTVKNYSAAIQGIEKGLVIAINADAMSIPNSSLCYAHKEERKLGNKGQAERLLKLGGKCFVQAAHKALKGEGKLKPSEVVAVRLNEANRGKLEGNAVLLINGPRVPKGKKTSAEHIAELGRAFINAADAAVKIKSASLTYTGISTGRFGFPPGLGGQVAMDSMLDALADGKIKRAVAAFWRNEDGSFEGSTAEGALATLFVNPNLEEAAPATFATLAGAEESTERSD